MTTIVRIDFDLMILACSASCFGLSGRISRPSTASLCQRIISSSQEHRDTYLDSLRPHKCSIPQQASARMEESPLCIVSMLLATTPPFFSLPKGALPREYWPHSRITATLSSLLESCSKTAFTNCYTQWLAGWFGDSFGCMLNFDGLTPMDDRIRYAAWIFDLDSSSKNGVLVP